jgi:ABC-2 type transport system ATP-binding protein
MEKSNIEVESLSLHKPTLDDVFMTLTGHKAEEEKEEK